MSNKRSIKLIPTQDGKGYDIGFENNRMIEDNSYDTSIVISLFSDARADASEKSQPDLRRGWEGDVYATLEGYFLGSKLWLHSQSRWSRKTINLLIADSENALDHFVNRGLATRIDVTGDLEQFDKINIYVKLFIDDNNIASFTVSVWRQSEFEQV